MPEIDFPRGGAKAAAIKLPNVNPGKRKAKHEDDDQPVDKKAFRKLEKDELDGLFKLPIVLNSLTNGVRCLGSIHKIESDSLALKIVNDITVTVPIKSVSQVYLDTYKKTKYGLEDLYSVGQLLACKVNSVASKVKGFKQIFATTCPSEVNDCIRLNTLLNGIVINATVVSIEEKGAIFDMGIDNKVKGFAPAEALPSLKSLKIGQVMLVRVVRESNDVKKYIKLSAYPETETFDEPSMTPNHLMPGTILNAEPQAMVNNGVIVSFKNGMKAFINKEYLPPRIRIDMDKLVRSFRVIVLVCSQNSPLLAVSAHPDIVAVSKVDRRLSSEDYEFGQVLDGIVYAAERKNIYFVFQETSDKVALVTAKLPQREMEDPDKVSKYQPGTLHKLRVLKYSPMDRLVIVTDRKELVKAGNIAEEYEPGHLITVAVDAIVEAGLRVSFGLNQKGMIFAIHTLDTPSDSWKKAFRVGQKIKSRILYQNEQKQYVLTCKPSFVDNNDVMVTEYDPELVGKTVTGVCISINAHGVVVAFFARVVGFLHKNQADLIPDLKIGSVVTVKVTRVDAEGRKMGLTIDATSDVPKATMKKIKKENDKPEKPKKPVKNLDIYNAKVLSKWPFGGTSKNTSVLVELPDENIGRLHVSELGPFSKIGVSDYVKKNKGKTVIVRVIDVSKVTKVDKKMRQKLTEIGVSKFYEVSVNPEKLKEKKMKQKLFTYKTNFKVGSEVDVYLLGTTAKAEINPKMQVIVKNSQNSVAHDGKVNVCKAIVKSFTKRTVTVKLVRPDGEEESESEEEQDVEMEDETESEIDAAENVESDDDVESEDGETDDLDEDEMETVGADATVGKKDSELSHAMKLLSGANLWDAEAIIPKQLKKVKKDVKKANKAEEEAKRERKKSETELVEEASDSDGKEENKILHTEKVLAGMERSSELFSDADYNRLVLSNPNSAESWIAYMAYQAQNGNIEEARKVAENALNTIDAREEEERLNVYNAFLNLEVLAGDEETLKNLFHRASAAHNPYEVYKRLANIFANAKKEDELDKLYNIMIKKFGQLKHEVYILYGTYLYKAGRKQDGRELMKKAMSSLPKKNHLEILSRFAHLEYLHGEVERGKTMFEKAIAAAPKRGDLWNIYIDKAIKFQSPEDTREIFERATAANLGMHTTKNLYQKWKDFEKLHGDEENQTEVEKQSAAFLKKSSKSADDVSEDDE